MVSFDVLNLFTNVPVEQILNHSKDAMTSNTSWQKVTELNMDQLLHLAEFCIKNQNLLIQG